VKLSSFQKGLLLVLFFIFLFGGILFVNQVWLGDAFNKEEAQHALYGLWLHKDLKALDFGSFWYDTERQMFWPFLHSWLLSLFFLLLGPSFFSARLLSLIIFFATLILMYLAACRFSEKSGWKIGALSVALAFASPIMLRFAVENTLEGLGALMFLGAYYLYTISEEKKASVYYIFLAILVGSSLYANYLYAYLMIPAFIVATLAKLGPIFVEVNALSRKGAKYAYPFLWWAYRKLIFISVLFLLASVWFLTSAFSRKIMLFLQAIFRFSGGEPVAGPWQNFIFYPKAIVENFTFSPWVGILMVAAIFTPFIAFNYLRAGKIYTFVWTTLLLATLTLPAKAPQFIYIIAPFILLLFSAAVIEAVERWQKYTAALLLLLIFIALPALPRLAKSYFPPRPPERTVTVLDYFRRGVLPRHPIASSFNLAHLNPEGIAFHFWDWNAPVLADPLVEQDEMFKGGRYFLSLEIDRASSYETEILDDSIHRWNAFLWEKMKAGEVREFSSRRFNSLGLTAKIHEKVSR
jgi:hypothetical protein